MARLRNPKTGSIVNVDDATAERLKAAGHKPAAKATRKEAAKSDDKAPAKSDDA